MGTSNETEKEQQIRRHTDREKFKNRIFRGVGSKK